MHDHWNRDTKASVEADNSDNGLLWIHSFWRLLRLPIEDGSCDSWF